MNGYIDSSHFFLQCTTRSDCSPTLLQDLLVRALADAIRGNARTTCEQVLAHASGRTLYNALAESVHVELLVYAVNSDAVECLRYLLLCQRDPRILVTVLAHDELHYRRAFFILVETLMSVYRVLAPSFRRTLRATLLAISQTVELPAYILDLLDDDGGGDDDETDGEQEHDTPACSLDCRALSIPQAIEHFSSVHCVRDDAGRVKSTQLYKALLRVHPEASALFPVTRKFSLAMSAHSSLPRHHESNGTNMYHVRET